MILPVSHISVLLLLLTSLICLGSWVNTFKAAGRWRFELFSIDFAIGGLVLVLAAAFTLGTLGSDLAFSDRMLVAGRTAQVLALVAGAVFNLGSMLLLAAVSLIGISTAFPLGIGLALVVSSCFHFRGAGAPYLIAGIVLMFAAAAFEMRFAAKRGATPPPVKKAPPLPAPVGAGQTTRSATSAPAGVHGPHVHSTKHLSTPAPKPRGINRSFRGIVAGVLAGLALGLVAPILQNCVPGDLGLGAYAAMLLFGIGVLASTLIYDFYFLNIAIEGAPLTFGSYFQGNVRQHFLGFAGGAMCLGGLVAVLLAYGAPTTAGVPEAAVIVVPLVSVILSFLFGVTVWKEILGVSSANRSALTAGIVLFAISLGLLTFGLTQ